MANLQPWQAQQVKKQNSPSFLKPIICSSEEQAQNSHCLIFPWLGTQAEDTEAPADSSAAALFTAVEMVPVMEI